MDKKSINAEIITIGTELLLGDVNDINTPFIAKQLNKLGIDVFRTITIGDNLQRIVRQITKSLEKADIVITTGGLGPTVDDPTRQAVADVFETDMQFRDDLWEQIQERFKRFNHTPTENNRKQAYIPAGAVAIENAVGTAPAFFYKEKSKMLICLPGVPAEVEFIFSNQVVGLLNTHFQTGLTTLTKVIRTAGIGESSVDDLIAEYETLESPTVGITAHAGQVDIRLTAKADNAQQALLIIKPIQNEITGLLSDHVFGYDDDTLEAILRLQIARLQTDLHLKHTSHFDRLVEELRSSNIFKSCRLIQQDEIENYNSDTSLYNSTKSDHIVVVLCNDLERSNSFNLSIIWNQFVKKRNFYFGGHQNLINQWMKSNILNEVRKFLKTQVNNE